MPDIMKGSDSPAGQLISLTFRRKHQSYNLNPPDESHNVTYLGNVPTIMAKGDASVEKPLGIIWKTYQTSKKQRKEIPMKLRITRSGLKVETKHLGLTEYWAHRVTYAAAPISYPRIFCWIYKHEGKRMKPELRCHAVLCRRAVEPLQISAALNLFLQTALQEYRREKLAVEKARKTSLTGTGPRRKMLLQTGSLNFRPPTNRSKSAPRLGAIDEEEEEEAMFTALDECDGGGHSDDEDPCDRLGLDNDLSDTESLCYRNTPIGGSANGDTSSLASSNTASTSSTANTSSPPASRFQGNSGIPDCGAGGRASHTLMTPERQEEMQTPTTAGESTGGGKDEDGSGPFHRQLSMSKDRRITLAMRCVTLRHLPPRNNSVDEQNEDQVSSSSCADPTSDETTSSCSSPSSSSSNEDGGLADIPARGDERGGKVQVEWYSRSLPRPQKSKAASWRRAATGSPSSTCEKSHIPCGHEEEVQSDESGYVEDRAARKEIGMKMAKV